MLKIFKCLILSLSVISLQACLNQEDSLTQAISKPVEIQNEVAIEKK